MNNLRILIIRNDKLGDFMLAWPAIALLKKSLPTSNVSVLVPHYTAELAKSCPWVDQVLTDPDDLQSVNRKNFDIVVTLFSTSRIGWQVWKGRIPLRVAPATKLAQVFYNHRVTQRRSRSEKPEYQYNIELIENLLRKIGVKSQGVPSPVWPLPADQIADQRFKLSEKLAIPSDNPWIFVHIGSGGSANNLSLEQYCALITDIDQNLKMRNHLDHFWVLTCGPGEFENTTILAKSLPDAVKHVVYHSTDGLVHFAHSLSCAQLMIAGSTGPLHIAGTIDVPTVGFYPSKRSATSLRWKTCNSEGRTLAFSPRNLDDPNHEISQSEINTMSVKITDWYSDNFLTKSSYLTDRLV